MVETANLYCEASHFAQSFMVLEQLRGDDIMTDITLIADDNCTTVKAHKLVLMAASDYFRTMFKACFTESDLQQLPLHGK